MTKRQIVEEDAKLSESDQLRSSDFLGVTRREVIATAAAGIAFLANFDDLAQAAEGGSGGDAGGVSENRSNSERQQQTVNRTDSAPRTEQREQVDEYSEIKSLLGSEFRGRSSSMQTLTTHQRDGTGTPEEPDRREVDAGAYFSNGFNRKLMSSSESPLGTALRTRSGGINSTARLSSEQKAALSAFVGATAQKQKPNEGRAEVFFGAVGATTAKLAGAYAAGWAGWALGAAGTANLAGLSVASLSMVPPLFETPGREAGEAFGRWVDPKIERFKEGTGYDSRTDPRFNPFGWPYD
jgi:hypothetical protein